MKYTPSTVSGVTMDGDRNKLIVCIVLILGSSIGTAAYWGASEKGWTRYCVSVPIWVVSTAGIWVFVPEARKPNRWGVPLVPWLPSASIFINIFLLGSIDKESFVRFGIWSLILLVYYLLFGLHATYDTSKSVELEMVEERKLGKVEAGEEGGSKGAVDAGISTGNDGNAPH